MLLADVKRHQWQLYSASVGVITPQHVHMQTGLTSIADSQHASLFGHVARLNATVPAHQILWLQTAVTIGQNPSVSWHRETAWLSKETWVTLTQIQDDVGRSARYWAVSICRDHERVTQRTTTVSNNWLRSFVLLDRSGELPSIVSYYSPSEVTSCSTLCQSNLDRVPVDTVCEQSRGYRHTAWASVVTQTSIYT